MDTSRVPDVIDALVTLCRAALDDDVTIYDGPTLNDGTTQQVVAIGWDGDLEGDSEAATADQEWAGLGARAKDELLVVNCAAIAWTGNGDIRPQRVRVYALVAAVENALRANPSLDFDPPTVAAFRTGNLHQQQTDHGPEARVQFQIAVQTRI